MRNQGIVSGQKMLNKVFSQYPNAYFTLHEGVTDSTTAATCSDENTSNNSSGNWELTVGVSANTGQWQTTEAMWVGEVGNTTNYLTMLRSIDSTTFDSIFSIDGKAGIFAAHVQRIATPGANGRIMSMGGYAGNSVPMEWKFLTTGDVQVFFRNVGIVAVALDATTTEAIVMMYYDHRSSGSKTVTARAYAPGTSNQLQTATSQDISVPTLPAAESTSAFNIGASKATSGVFSNHADSVRIKRVRVINFDQSPPSDIGELLDELAINNLMGSRR